MVVLLGAVALAGAAAYAGRSNREPANGAASGSCCPGGSSQRMTLDPGLFKGPVRDAYEVAERDPALLAQLHCYCGCDQTDGHQNLLDCFRDRHGATCAICVSEARYALDLAGQGVPIEQIRDILRRLMLGPGKRD